MNALSLRRDPVRLALSPAPWASLRYLVSGQIVGWVLFGVALAAMVVAGALSLTLAGLPVLISTAAIIRWCANVERVRLRIVDPEPVRGGYREVSGLGIMARVRVRWRDAATWRDVACLVGVFVPLAVLDIVVLSIWVTFLAGITMPAWYWAPPQTFDNGTSAHGIQFGYFPNGPHGPGGHGLFVDTLPKALLAAAACLVALLLFNYVLVAVARTHAAVARGLLRPPADPLREAKAVLRRPGPLGSFLPDGAHRL